MKMESSFTRPYLQHYQLSHVIASQNPFIFNSQHQRPDRIRTCSHAVVVVLFALQRMKTAAPGQKGKREKERIHRKRERRPGRSTTVGRVCENASKQRRRDLHAKHSTNVIQIGRTFRFTQFPLSCICTGLVKHKHVCLRPAAVGRKSGK